MEAPHRAPQGTSAVAAGDAAGVESVRIGQKLIIFAILANIASVALAQIHPLLGLSAFAALALTFYGLYKLSKGLRAAAWLQVIIFIAMFIPLVNLLVLLRINAKATQTLRAAGYSVGLLGARKQSVA